MTICKPMHITMIATFAVASAAALVTMANAAGAEAEGAKGTYRVDPVHSSVIFKIKHLNTTNFYGRFNEAIGTFDLGEGGSIQIKINMDSLVSGNPKRDQHLRSPDFFSIKEFPEAAFKSTSLKKTGDNMYQAAGDLTMHGVTKPITATIEHTGEGKGMRGNPISGIEAKLKIKRSDFGMKYMPEALGDDVEIIASLEGGK